MWRSGSRLLRTAERTCYVCDAASSAICGLALKKGAAFARNPLLYRLMVVRRTWCRKSPQWQSQALRLGF